MRSKQRIRWRFNSQPPEGGWAISREMTTRYTVSTHSRPKAAGLMQVLTKAISSCFNSQPPEGGWDWCITNSNT